MAWRLRVLLLLVLMVGAGCSLSGGNEPTTYVASGDREALLVSWVRDSGDRVTGTIQEARAAGAKASKPVESSSTSFTGALTGTAVSLQIGGQFGGILGSTITGALHGDTLTLNVPTQNGQVGRINLARSTTDTYNAAVSHIESLVETERAQAASDQADQDAREALAASSDQLEADIQELKTDTADLRSSAGDLSSAVDDVRTALKAQQKLARETKTVGCDDYPSVQSDESGAAADVEGASSDYDGAVSDYEAAVDATGALHNKVDNRAASVRDAGGTLPNLEVVAASETALKDAAAIRRSTHRQIKKLLKDSTQIDDDTQALTRC